MTYEFATEMNEMLRQMARAVQHATKLTHDCVGGGAERFRDACVCASVVRSSYSAAVEIREGYGGLEPGARYLALQELCDTITECIVAIESMLPQNRAATDAGVN